MADQIANLFLSASVKRMQLSEDEINRCLAKLSDEQMWHRGADHENSIGNLLLHLEGNLRQWFLHGAAQRFAAVLLQRSPSAEASLGRFRLSVSSKPSIPSRQGAGER